MDSSSEKPSIWARKFSRRTALKAAAAAGAAGLAGAAVLKNLLLRAPDQSLPTPPTPEALKQLSSNIVVIDFAPTEPKEGINQTVFPNKELLDPIDIPPEIKEAVFDRFGNHGEQVASAMNRVLKKLGFTSTVNLYPLQNALNPQNIETSQDELGNQIFFLKIDLGALKEALQQYPDQKVVNLSLQLGKVGISLIERERKIVRPVDYPVYVALPDGRVQYYSPEHKLITQTKEEYEAYKNRLEEEGSEVITRETPSVEIKEAYSKEDVEQNLPHLFALCNAFPNKLFVAAAGNEGENLEAVVDRPDNLLLVAQWNGFDQRPQHSVYGADIYVDNEELTLPYGSSFSTPVISAVASILVDQGLTIEQVKNKIKATSRLETGNTEQYRVFNPNMINR